MVHMNYHPDKHKRMLCVWDRYVEGRHSTYDAMKRVADAERLFYV